jgi:hypothetical protein
MHVDFVLPCGPRLMLFVPLYRREPVMAHEYQHSSVIAGDSL